MYFGNDPFCDTMRCFPSGRPNWSFASHKTQTVSVRRFSLVTKRLCTDRRKHFLFSSAIQSLKARVDLWEWSLGSRNKTLLGSKTTNLAGKVSVKFDRNSGRKFMKLYAWRSRESRTNSGIVHFCSKSVLLAGLFLKVWKVKLCCSFGAIQKEKYIQENLRKIFQHILLWKVKTVVLWVPFKRNT